jgi:aspartyl/glutamyl-tRNA(Asn/Gln) amidotransferase C subunit
MSLDKATVAKVANLARIRVEEKDLEPLANEMNAILGWVEQLSEVDTDDVAPMTSVAQMKSLTAGIRSKLLRMLQSKRMVSLLCQR